MSLTIRWDTHLVNVIGKKDTISAPIIKLFLLQQNLSAVNEDQSEILSNT
jgi:hypothetical protein